MVIRLSSLADTQRLGEWLAEKSRSGIFSHLLLNGPLGCGKTTLARYYVTNLPDGENAEVSSPSFTICNEYPTKPPILHCDLYRCHNNIPEEIIEGLDADDKQIILEWSSYMPANYLPADYLDIRFLLDNNERLLFIESIGQNAQRLVTQLNRDWHNQTSDRDCP